MSNSPKSQTLSQSVKPAASSLPESSEESDAGDIASAAGSITIVLNGEKKSIDTSSTVQSLLSAIHRSEKNCAVEINEIIIEKSAYSSTLIRAGDAVEIVRFVGGG